MKTFMPKLTTALFLCMLLLFTNCSQQDKEYYKEDITLTAPASANELETEDLDQNEAPEVLKEDVTRKLIKQGFIEFETESIDSTRTKILESVQQYQGYVSSDKIYKTAGRNSITLEVRIPAANFDEFLADASQNVEELDLKNIHVEDVTEEFLDIQARVKTKKELEQRYIQLLQKAQKVSEILEIESQLGDLRAEIESIEGRLKYLKNQVSMSTLTITFYQTVPRQTEFGQKFKDGFYQGWDNFIWCFVILINIWPFILIGLGFLAILIFYIRKNNRK